MITTMRIQILKPWIIDRIQVLVVIATLERSSPSLTEDDETQGQQATEK